MKLFLLNVGLYFHRIFAHYAQNRDTRVHAFKSPSLFLLLVVTLMIKLQQCNEINFLNQQDTVTPTLVKYTVKVTVFI